MPAGACASPSCPRRRLAEAPRIGCASRTRLTRAAVLDATGGHSARRPAVPRPVGCRATPRAMLGLVHRRTRMTTPDRRARALPRLPACARRPAASRSAPAGARWSAIRGDADDVFSRGFICPKGYALKELDADPDRLRTPLVQARRPARSRRRGTRRSPRSSARLHADHRASTAATRSPSTSAIPSAHSMAAGDLQPGVPARARHAEHLLGQHRRPDAEAGRGRG